MGINSGSSRNYVLNLGVKLKKLTEQESKRFNVAYGLLISVHHESAYFFKIINHNPKNRSWNVPRMNKVLKIKVFLGNFGFIRSHFTGEFKILQKSLRFSALGIRSSFNYGF